MAGFDQTSQTFVAARESTENIPASRRVRDVADRIAYLDPDIAPLTLVLSKGRNEKCSNSKFEWIEKELANKWDQVNGTSTTGETTINVDNGPYFKAGDLVKIPATGENFLVSSVSSNALTVVRTVGTTGSATVPDNTDVVIIGTAYPEGGALPDLTSHVETYPYNYTQIFRKVLGVTGTEDQSENYTGKDRPRLRAEMAKEHKLDMERSAIFGEREISTTGGDSTNKPRRFTGGLLYYLTRNNKAAGGTLTEPEIEDWLEDVMHHTSSGSTRLLLASPLVVSVFDQFGMGRLQMVPKDKTFGISIQQFVTSHGSLNIVKHRLLENGVSGTNGWAGYAIAVDPSKLAKRTLGNRDTKLRVDVGTPGDDGFTDEYLTECGWQVELPKAHGVLTGVSS